MKNYLKSLIVFLLVIVCLVAYSSCSIVPGTTPDDKPGTGDQPPDDKDPPSGEGEDYRVRFVYSYTAKIVNDNGRTDYVKEAPTVDSFYFALSNDGLTAEQLAKISQLSYNGYTFVKWYSEWDTDKQVGIAGTEVDFNSLGKITKDITFYGERGNLAGQTSTWKIECYKDGELLDATITSPDDIPSGSDVVLTISGTGKMFDFANANEIDILWNQYKNYVTKVVIEDGITSVGANSFNGFSKLKSIELPDTVTVIGSSAFENCTSNSLRSFTCPPNLVTIESNAFVNAKFRDVVLNDGLKTIGDSAFRGVNSMRTIVVPASVTSIGIGAFHPGVNASNSNNTHNLSKVYYKGDAAAFSAITIAMDNAWFNELATIYYYTEDETVGNSGAYWHYADNKSGERTNVPVQYCYSIKYFTPTGSLPFAIHYVPASPAVDANGDFVYDSDEVIVLEGKITEELITARDTLRYNGYLFDGYKAIGASKVELKAGDVIDDDLSYTLKRGNKLNDDGGIIWSYNSGTLTISVNPNAPEGASKRIWDFATALDTGVMWTATDSNPNGFGSLKSIKTLVIGEGVEYIGRLTFAGLVSITEVLLPSSVTEIAENAFDGCSALTAIYYDGSDASACKIVNNAGETVSALSGVNAALYSKTLTATADEGSYWMTLTDATGAKKRIAWSLTLTKAEDGTVTAGKLVVAGDNVMINFEHPEQAPWYAAKDLITSVTLSSNITSVAENLVSGYTKVTSISLPAALRTIPASAFAGTGILNNTAKYDRGLLIVNGHLLKVDSSTRNKELFETVSGIINIAGGAFDGCTEIQRIFIAGTIQNINPGVFDGCEINTVYYDGAPGAWLAVSASLNLASDVQVLYKEGTVDTSTGEYLAWVKSGNDYGILGCIHDYGDWIVTKEANCRFTGTEERTCNRCGKVDERDIPVSADHVFTDYVKIEEATCQHGTIETAKCSMSSLGCKATDERELDDKLDHQYGEFTYNNDATCDTAGTKSKVCTICNADTVTEEDADHPAFGHTYGDYVSNGDAQCNLDGTKSRSCSVCGNVETVTDEGTTLDYHYYINVVNDDLFVGRPTPLVSEYLQSCKWCGTKGVDTFEVEVDGIYTFDDMNSLVAGKAPVFQPTKDEYRPKYNGALGTANDVILSLVKDETGNKSLVYSKTAATGVYKPVWLMNKNNSDKLEAADAVHVVDTDFLFTEYNAADLPTGQRYVLELGLRIDQGTKDDNYRFFFFESDNGNSLTLYSSTTVNSETVIAEFKKGVAYNVRIEARATDVAANTASVTFVVTNTEDGTSVSKTLEKNSILSKMDCVYLEMRAGAESGTFYFDNTYFATVSAAELDRTNGNCDGEHNFENSVWVSNGDKTCLEDGTKSRVCMNDGCTFVETEIDENNLKPEGGHAWSEYVYNEDANCGVSGTETRTCSACGETETRDSEEHLATGEHTYGDPVVDENSATCQTGPTATATCTVCGATKTELVEGGETVAHSFVNVVSQDYFASYDSESPLIINYYVSCKWCGAKGAKTFNVVYSYNDIDTLVVGNAPIASVNGFVLNGEKGTEKTAIAALVDGALLLSKTDASGVYANLTLANSGVKELEAADRVHVMETDFYFTGYDVTGIDSTAEQYVLQWAFASEDGYAKKFYFYPGVDGALNLCSAPSSEAVIATLAPDTVYNVRFVWSVASGSVLVYVSDAEKNVVTAVTVENKGVSSFTGLYVDIRTASKAGEYYFDNTYIATVSTDDLNPTPSDEHEHVFGEWMDNNDLTCTTNGTKSRVCQIAGCNEYEVEIVTEAQGHNMSEFVYNEDAACGVPGTKTSICQNEGCSYSETVDDPDHPALEHQFGEYVADNNATCLAGGTKTAVCALCGEKDVVDNPDDPQVEHLWKWSANNDATCDTPGTKNGVCEYCGTVNNNVVDADKYPAMGHYYIDYVPDGNGTCDTQGTMSATCVYCGNVDSIPDPMYPASGHNMSDFVYNNNASCIEDGTMTSVCLNPGCDYSVTELDPDHPKLGEHAWSNFTIIKGSATCQHPTQMVRSCAVCGEEEYADVAGAKPLDYHSFANVVAPDYFKSYVGTVAVSEYYTSCEWCGEKAITTFVVEADGLVNFDDGKLPAFITSGANFKDEKPTDSNGNVKGIWSTILEEDVDGVVNKYLNVGKVGNGGSHNMTLVAPTESNSEAYVLEYDIRWGWAANIREGHNVPLYINLCINSTRIIWQTFVGFDSVVVDGKNTVTSDEWTKFRYEYVSKTTSGYDIYIYVDDVCVATGSSDIDGVPTVKFETRYGDPSNPALTSDMEFDLDNMIFFGTTKNALAGVSGDCAEGEHVFGAWHDNNDAGCTTDGTATAICQVPGCTVTTNKVVSEPTGHSFGSWMHYEDADCDSDASEIRYCKNSGCDEFEIRYDEGTAFGHSVEEYIYNNDVTCITDGTKSGVCSVCGEIDTIVDDEHLAINQPHYMSAWVDNNDATCDAAGTKTRYCMQDGCSYSETVSTGEPLGHNHVFTYNNDATCTEDGTETAVCSVCEDTFTRTAEGTKLGHSYLDDSYVSNGDATCTEDGTKSAYCANGCGEINTIVDIGSKLGHEFVETANNDASCYKNGTITVTCTRCDYNAIVDDENAPATGAHVYLLYVYNGDRDCETDGTMTAHCMTPGCTASDTVPDPHHKKFGAHSIEDWTLYEDATCEHVAIEARICSICGHVEEKRNVEGSTLVDHSYVNVVKDEYIKSLPTHNTAGVYYQSCEWCGVKSAMTFEIAQLGYTFDSITEDTLPPAFAINGIGLLESAPASAATGAWIEKDGDNSYLRIDRVNTNATSTIRFETDYTVADAEKYVFDFDFRYVSASVPSSGDATRLFLTMFTAGASHNNAQAAHGVARQEFKTTVASDFKSINFTSCTNGTMKAGEWHNITFEFNVDYTDGKQSGYTVKFYIDGALSFTKKLTHQSSSDCKHGENEICRPSAWLYFSNYSAKNSSINIDNYNFSIVKKGDTVPVVGDCAEDAHNFGDNWINTPGSCTEDAYRTTVCQNPGCSAIKTEITAAADGHNVEFTYNNDATCTEDGTKSGVCSDCGETITVKDDEHPATEHDFTEWTTTTPANCTDNEIKSRYCQNPGCDCVETDEIEDSALGHSFGAWQTHTPADCTNNRVDIRYCDRPGCDCSETNEVADTALGHTVDSWTYNEDATCVDDGTKSGVCTVCGETDTVIAEGTSTGSHAYGDPVLNENSATCQNGPTETLTCTVCGATETRPVEGGEPVAHNFVNVVADKYLKSLPAYNAAGLCYQSCEWCGLKGTETFEYGFVDYLANGERWPAFDYAGYTVGAPTSSGGANAYITKDEGSDNLYMRFEKNVSASDTSSQYIYMQYKEKVANAKKYVYEFDFRWGGATDAGTAKRVFSAKVMAGGTKNSDKGNHAVNYYQNPYNCTLGGGNFAWGNGSLKVGEWYNIRYEFTVTSAEGVSPLTYNVKAYLDGSQIVNQNLTENFDRAPAITYVMYGSYTPDNMIFDIDNYNASVITADDVTSEVGDCEDGAHNFVDDWTYVEGDCTHDTYKTRVCQNAGCSVIETETIIEAPGHNMTDFIYNDDATCGVQGTMTSTCQNEGCSYSETVDDPDHPALEHECNDYVITDPTCYEAGSKVGVCINCGETLTEELPVLDHNFVYVPNNDATCHTAGTKTGTCELCGATETVVDENAPATGNHVYQLYSYNEDQSCVVNGTMTAYCVVDGCTASETIDHPHYPATGEHSWSEWEEVADSANCQQPTQKTRSCSVCGEVAVEDLEGAVALDHHNFVNVVADQYFKGYVDNHVSQLEYYESCSWCGAKGVNSFAVTADGLYTYENGARPSWESYANASYIKDSIPTDATTGEPKGIWSVILEENGNRYNNLGKKGSTGSHLAKFAAPAASEDGSYVLEFDFRWNGATNMRTDSDSTTPLFIRLPDADNKNGYQSLYTFINGDNLDWGGKTLVNGEWYTVRYEFVLEDADANNYTVTMYVDSEVAKTYSNIILTSLPYITFETRYGNSTGNCDLSLDLDNVYFANTNAKLSASDCEEGAHTWDPLYSAKDEWSCNTDGTAIRVCQNPGCSVTETIVVKEATGEHTWSDWAEVADSASCQQPTQETRTCSVCGETEYRNLEGATVLDHVYVQSVADDFIKSVATYNSPAVYYKSCQWCGLESDETFTDGAQLGYAFDTTETPVNMVINKADSAATPIAIQKKEDIGTSGLYFYIDSEDDNNFLRVSKTSTAVARHNFINEVAGANKYVYEFDFRWNGADMSDTTKGRAFLIDVCNTTTFVNSSGAANHTYKINWYQYQASIIYGSDTTSLRFNANGGSSDMTLGEWYHVRFEFVKNTDGGYNGYIYVNGNQVGNAIVLKAGTTVPYVSFYNTGNGASQRPSSTCYDIDNYYAFAE